MRIGLVLGVWVLAVVAGFWWFAGKYFVPVGRPAGSADPASLIGRKTEPEGTITVLDFWNPDCPCSRFMEAHVRSLEKLFAKRPVRFVHIVEGTDASNAPQPSRLDRDGAMARRYGVWAAPSAVVLDSSGRVVYIGAYNVSRFCDDDETAFAKKAILAALDGKRPKVDRLPFYGCKNLGAP